MKRKIIIFQTHLSTGTGGGIAEYCRSLQLLFQNNELFNVEVCPILPHKNHFLGNEYDMEKVRDYLRRTNPDIIHVNGYTSLIVKQLFNFASQNKIKLIYTPHWHPFNSMRWPLLKRLYFNTLVKPHIKNADQIICINSEEKKFFQKLNPNVTKICHWLKTAPYPSKIQRVKNRILFVGNLCYRNKGFDALFDLPQGRYEIHCVGRGNTPLRDDMTQHTDISNDELSELYSSSSLLIVPSHYEAFSYVALEALSHGTPIVISDKVRISEYINNPDACRVYKLFDKKDMNAKVADMIGRSFDISSVMHPFSSSAALSSYTKIYTETLQ